MQIIQARPTDAGTQELSKLCYNRENSWNGIFFVAGEISENYNLDKTGDI